MKIKHRKTLIIAILFSLLFFAGCYSYRDINKVIFVTSMLIDLDDNDNIVVYTDTLRPYRDAGESSERGQRGIYKGEGSSLLEALSNMGLSASAVLDYSQNKVVIFSEKAAEKGVDRFMDYLNRSKEQNVKSYLFVYYGNIEKLIKMASSNEDYLGNYLIDVINKVGASSKTIFLNINDYLTQKRLGNGITIITALELQEEAGEEKLHLVGGGVIQEGKLIERLDDKEVLNLNLLTRGVKKGTIEVPNPLDRDNLITLDILSGSTSTKLEIVDGNPTLVKNIKLKGMIGEAQGDLILTRSTINKIASEAELSLVNSTEAFYQEFNSKGVDILNLTRELEIKRVSEERMKDFNNIKLLVNPQITIQGTSNIQNTN